LCSGSVRLDGFVFSRDTDLEKQDRDLSEVNVVAYVLFRSPSGDEIRDPRPLLLREVILEKGPEWWSYDAGDVSLYHTSASGEAQLILVLERDFGIFVQHLGAIESDERVLARQDKGIRDPIEVTVGGEPMRIPKRYFVPRDIALVAALEFCRSGLRVEPGAGLAWEIPEYD
jgi:hypothetical protein